MIALIYRREYQLSRLRWKRRQGRIGWKGKWRIWTLIVLIWTIRINSLTKRGVLAGVGAEDTKGKSVYMTRNWKLSERKLKKVLSRML